MLDWILGSYCFDHKITLKDGTNIIADRFGWFIGAFLGKRVIRLADDKGKFIGWVDKRSIIEELTPKGLGDTVVKMDGVVEDFFKGRRSISERELSKRLSEVKAQLLDVQQDKLLFAYVFKTHVLFPESSPPPPLSLNQVRQRGLEAFNECAAFAKRKENHVKGTIGEQAKKLGKKGDLMEQIKALLPPATPHKPSMQFVRVRTPKKTPQVDFLGNVMSPGRATARAAMAASVKEAKAMAASVAACIKGIGMPRPDALTPATPVARKKPKGRTLEEIATVFYGKGSVRSSELSVLSTLMLREIEQKFTLYQDRRNQLMAYMQDWIDVDSGEILIDDDEVRNGYNELYGPFCTACEEIERVYSLCLHYCEGNRKSEHLDPTRERLTDLQKQMNKLADELGAKQSAFQESYPLPIEDDELEGDDIDEDDSPTLFNRFATGQPFDVKEYEALGEEVVRCLQTILRESETNAEVRAQLDETLEKFDELVSKFLGKNQNCPETVFTSFRETLEAHKNKQTKVPNFSSRSPCGSPARPSSSHAVPQQQSS